MRRFGPDRSNALGLTSTTAVAAELPAVKKVRGKRNRASIDGEAFARANTFSYSQQAILGGCLVWHVFRGTLRARQRSRERSERLLAIFFREGMPWLEIAESKYPWQGLSPAEVAAQTGGGNNILVRSQNVRVNMQRMCKVKQDDVLQDLLQRRRAAHDRFERANLSKLIRKHLRQNMRRRRNARVSRILAEFKDLGRLESAHIAPIRRIERASLGPTPDMFGSCLGNIFMSDIGHETATLASLDDSDCLSLVPPFTLQELGAVLRDLHYGKAADADGMVAEMFKYSNIPLQTCLLDIYNSMIASGSFEMSWQHTLFSMLPKSGDSSQPTNWRPIAVLKITYKIFSRLLYNRLRVMMDEQQPNDQTGFRPNTGIDDAFVVLECLSSKSLGWNAPIWLQV